MLWIVAILAFIILIALYIFARPANIYDGDRGFVIYNTLMGYPCMEGRVFRTQKQAEKAMAKLAANNVFSFPGVFEVRYTV